MATPPPGYKFDYSGNPMDPDLVPISDTTGASIGNYGYNVYQSPDKTILDYDGSLESARAIMATALRKGDQATLDKIADYYREDTIRREGYDREDSAYQRLYNDIAKTGINPIALMQGASPISSNFGYGSSGTSQYSSAKQLSESQRHNKTSESISIVSLLVQVLSTIAVVAAMA